MADSKLFVPSHSRLFTAETIANTHEDCNNKDRNDCNDEVNDCDDKDNDEPTQKSAAPSVIAASVKVSEETSKPKAPETVVNYRKESVKLIQCMPSSAPSCNPYGRQLKQSKRGETHLYRVVTSEFHSKLQDTGASISNMSSKTSKKDGHVFQAERKRIRVEPKQREGRNEKRRASTGIQNATAVSGSPLEEDKKEQSLRYYGGQQSPTYDGGLQSPSYHGGLSNTATNSLITILGGTSCYKKKRPHKKPYRYSCTNLPFLILSATDRGIYICGGGKGMQVGGRVVGGGGGRGQVSAVGAGRVGAVGEQGGNTAGEGMNGGKGGGAGGRGRGEEGVGGGGGKGGVGGVGGEGEGGRGRREGEDEEGREERDEYEEGKGGGSGGGEGGKGGRGGRGGGGGGRRRGGGGGGRKGGEGGGRRGEEGGGGGGAGGGRGKIDRIGVAERKKIKHTGQKADKDGSAECDGVSYYKSEGLGGTLRTCFTVSSSPTRGLITNDGRTPPNKQEKEDDGQATMVQKKAKPPPNISELANFIQPFPINASPPQSPLVTLGDPPLDCVVASEEGCSIFSVLTMGGTGSYPPNMVTGFDTFDYDWYPGDQNMPVEEEREIVSIYYNIIEPFFTVLLISFFVMIYILQLSKFTFKNIQPQYLKLVRLCTDYSAYV